MFNEEFYRQAKAYYESGGDLIRFLYEQLYFNGSEMSILGQLMQSDYFMYNDQWSVYNGNQFILNQMLRQQKKYGFKYSTMPMAKGCFASFFFTYSFLTHNFERDEQIVCDLNRPNLYEVVVEQKDRAEFVQQIINIDAHNKEADVPTLKQLKQTYAHKADLFRHFIGAIDMLCAERADDGRLRGMVTSYPMVKVPDYFFNEYKSAILAPTQRETHEGLVDKFLEFFPDGYEEVINAIGRLIALDIARCEEEMLNPIDYRLNTETIQLVNNYLVNLEADLTTYFIATVKHYCGMQSKEEVEHYYTYEEQEEEMDLPF